VLEKPFAKRTVRNDDEVEKKVDLWPGCYIVRAVLSALGKEVAALIRLGHQEKSGEKASF